MSSILTPPPPPIRYRIRVLAQMGPDASEQDRNTVREQLSGACTTEIAALRRICRPLGRRRGHLPSYHLRYRTNRAYASSPQPAERRGVAFSRVMIRTPPAWGRIPASRCKRLASERRWQRSLIRIHDHHPRGSTRNQRDRRGGANLSGASYARCLEPASGREWRVLGQRPIRLQQLHRWKTRASGRSRICRRRSGSSRATIFGCELSTCWG